jgi:hypothetical protein
MTVLATLKTHGIAFALPANLSLTAAALTPERLWMVATTFPRILPQVMNLLQRGLLSANLSGIPLTVLTATFVLTFTLLQTFATLLQTFD